MSKHKYYVVWKGRRPGIYSSWPEAEKQVKGAGLKLEARAEEIAQWIGRIDYDGQLGDLRIHFDSSTGAAIHESLK